jgi:hypothetical protein
MKATKMNKYAMMISICGIISCSTNPPASSNVLYLDGSKVGKVKYYENTISFVYPGNSINTMQVFHGDSLIQTCEEADYEKVNLKGGWVNNGAGGSFKTGDSETIMKKDNIDCHLQALVDTVFVKLFSYDQYVSKYRIITKP